LFFGIGESFQNATSPLIQDGGKLTAFGKAAKAVSHGIAGGIVSSMEGGRFGHSFASAGITELAMPMIDEIGHPLAEATAASLLNGSLTAATGGKFANGAVTGAFQDAFNEHLHAMLQHAEAYQTGQAQVDPAVLRQMAEILVLAWGVEIAMATPWGRAAKVADVGHAVWVEARAAKGVSALEDASGAAFRAAERVGEFSVPLKHLPDAAGRWAKFAEGTNPNALIREALSSPYAKFLPNSVESSYKVVTDLGRVVGTNGETRLRVIIGQDGKIWTAFPVK
jgi:hypothetical protein